MERRYQALVCLIRAACAQDGETPGPSWQGILEATRVLVDSDERLAEQVALFVIGEHFDYLLHAVAGEVHERRTPTQTGPHYVRVP